MFKLQDEEFSRFSLSDYLIPAERVAHVQIGNNVEHALLVLTKSGYTAIPVLDPTYKLHGLISTPIIMESILGLERIEFEKLEQKRVEEVMLTDIPRLKTDSSPETCLNLLVDHPFLCVEDEDGLFEGILTRRAILLQLSKRLQQIEKTEGS
ncbi:cyclic-di-AMP-binding protein CbpB [Bacillus marasmi]|uniref:cyclic-di-AMP-binding protein CbpB n=1 Tax=Bacillus marasmi TaxID=1926279 RepID=UPI0011CA22E1|nr:cyclic-di-AMP-binding protein CbpB [Bacillus marasmi]